MQNSSGRNLLVWVRRSFGLAFVLAYLGAGGFFFYSHLIGDTGRFASGYFWTWDMFPNYPSFSSRRTALGQTKSGRYVEVFPTSKVRYRRGGHRDLTRFDFPRNDASLRLVVAETLKLQEPQEASDPVTYVFLIEKTWPVRFNLPDDLYEEVYREPNPRRHAWRIVDEGAVGKDGEIRWTSSQ